MSALRRVTAPPIELAEAVTNSMRVDNSPENSFILRSLFPVFSPPQRRDGAGSRAKERPGRLSFTPGLFR